MEYRYTKFSTGGETRNLFIYQSRVVGAAIITSLWRPGRFLKINHKPYIMHGSNCTLNFGHLKKCIFLNVVTLTSTGNNNNFISFRFEIGLFLRTYSYISIILHVRIVIKHELYREYLHQILFIITDIDRLADFSFHCS